jgi:hypothetical protein
LVSTPDSFPGPWGGSLIMKGVRLTACRLRWSVGIRPSGLAQEYNPIRLNEKGRSRMGLRGPPAPGNHPGAEESRQ